MANSNGLVLWIAGGAGVLLLYSAVKNKTPQSVLMSSLGNGTVQPIVAPSVTTGGSTGNGSAGGGGNLGAGGGGVGYHYGPLNSDGTIAVFDSQGNQRALVPQQYAQTYHTYIPPAQVIAT